MAISEGSTSLEVVQNQVSSCGVAQREPEEHNLTWINYEEMDHRIVSETSSI